jgi:predicted MFS family arabinose efflux permease
MGARGALSQVSGSALQVVAGRKVGMGTVLGLGSAGNGLGIVLGSVVGGLLFDHVSLAAAFLFGGATMACGMPVFLALTRHLRLDRDSLAEPVVARARVATEAAANT